MFKADNRVFNVPDPSGKYDELSTTRTTLVDSSGEFVNSASSPALNFYSLQDYVSPYIGTTKNDGIWLIKKWESGSMRYANISNNPTKTIYSDAWTDRADLVYELIEELTGI